MFDFALLAKGGADKADRSTAVALDFEVERKRFAFNGHKISIIDSTNQVKIDYCMATNEMENGCGLSTEALLAGNLKRRCVKTTRLCRPFRNHAKPSFHHVPYEC